MEAKRTYDRYSRFYDWIGGQLERQYAQFGVNFLDIVPGEIVLEIGYGTGHMILALAKKVGPTGKVIGIDISPKMYEIAQHRVKTSGLETRVNLLCADALELTLAKSTFDAIFMSFTLELFDTPEIPLLLAKCRRLLKSGGQIGVVALSKCQGTTRMVRLYEWVNRFFPQWVDCRPIYSEQALKESGFKICKSKIQHMFGLPIEIIVAQKS
ncbi:MAG: class I SAM-dependent methyltransferase [Candidatus Thorarchaeota archaeon]